MKPILLVVFVALVLACGGVVLAGAGGAAWYYLSGQAPPVTAPEPVATVDVSAPSRAATELAEGLAALEAGNPRDAVVHLDLALAEEPANPVALRARAKAHTRLEQEDRAASDYAALLVVLPDDVDALFGHAWCLHRLGQDDAAFADTERLVTLAPERGDVWTLRAECLWQLGKAELAVSSAARACELGHVPGCTAVERFRSVQR